MDPDCRLKGIGNFHLFVELYGAYITELMSLGCLVVLALLVRARTQLQ